MDQIHVHTLDNSGIQAFHRVLCRQTDRLHHQVHPCHNSNIQAFHRIMCRQTAWTRSKSICATTLTFKLSTELFYRQTAWTRQPILATTLTREFFCVDRQCGPDPRPPLPLLWHFHRIMCRQTMWTRSKSIPATTLTFKLCYNQRSWTRQPILPTTLTREFFV
jgi:hypothetical protein